MRRWFHCFLLVASVARLASIILDVELQDEAGTAKLLTWAVALGHALPELFFLSTYSLLIFFWAQLYHRSTIRTTRSRSAYIALNVVVYAVLLVIAIITAQSSTQYKLFRVYSLYLR